MASVIVVFRIATRKDAESILSDMPDVRLAAAAEKYPAANARSCLAYVRQAHALEPATQPLSGQPLADDLLEEDVRRVQAEIYEISKALVRTHDVREVRCEALGPENERDVNETYRSRRDSWLNGPRDSSQWRLLDEHLSLSSVDGPTGDDRSGPVDAGRSLAHNAFDPNRPFPRAIRA